MLIPFEKVEEAVVEITFKRLVDIPPVKEEVAVVVALIASAVIVPDTPSAVNGVVVPIPTDPFVIVSPWTAFAGNTPFAVPSPV